MTGKNSVNTTDSHITTYAVDGQTVRTTRPGNDRMAALCGPQHAELGDL